MTFRKAALFLVLAVVVMFILLPVTASAQSNTPTPTPQPTTVTSNAPDAIAILSDIQRTEDRVNSAVNSFSIFLNIVQLVGTGVAMVAFIAGYFGIRDIGQIRNSVTEQLAAAKAALATATQQLEAADKAAQHLQSDMAAFEDQQREFAKRFAEMEHLKTQTQQELLSVTERSNRVTTALALSELAQQQISLGNLKTALGTLQSACQIDEENRVLRYFLGDVCVRLERVDVGLDHLRKALDGGHFPEARLAYAYALRLQGDSETDFAKREGKYAEAIQIFVEEFQNNSDALDISGESAFGALAGLYRRQKRYPEAITIYEHAHRVTPDSSYPVNNLGILYYLNGDKPNALRYFALSKAKAEEKLRLKPSDYWTWFDLITARTALDEEASEIRAQLEETFPRTSGTKPLEKLLLGLRELVSIPNGPRGDEQIMKRIEEEIQRRLAPA